MISSKNNPKYTFKYLIKELFLFTTGYYSDLKNLVKISWYVHILLFSTIMIGISSWFGANSLFSFILYVVKDESTRAHIFNPKRFIDSNQLNQWQLLLFCFYTIVNNLFYLSAYLFFVFLYAKIFLALIFYRHEINLTDSCKWKVFCDLLWNPIFPIYSYKKLNNKRVIYIKRKPPFSLADFMNNILKFQIFPEIDKQELIKVKNLSFLYHSDHGWDKYWHLFLKKYIPKIYQKHMIKNNVLSKSEILTKNIKNIKALKNIDLTIFASKFTTILGCNGSSKTTLLKAIINLFESYEGEILWINKDLKKISTKSFFKNVSYIPQNWDKNLQISLYEFVSYGLFADMPFFKFNVPKNHPKIIDNLKKMGIYKYMNKNLSLLSGGEKQRAILARALTQETKVIILDEPTTYLDIKNQYLILEILKELQVKEGKTIITILHDLQQAKQFSDNLILLEKGEVYASGNTISTMTEKNINYLFK